MQAFNERDLLEDIIKIGDAVVTSYQGATRLTKATINTFRRVKAAINADEAPIDDGWEIVDDNELTADNNQPTQNETKKMDNASKPVAATPLGRPRIPIDGNIDDVILGGITDPIHREMLGIQVEFKKLSQEPDAVREKVLQAKWRNYQQMLSQNRRKPEFAQEGVKTSWAFSPTSVFKSHSQSKPSTDELFEDTNVEHERRRRDQGNVSAIKKDEAGSDEPKTDLTEKWAHSSSFVKKTTQNPIDDVVEKLDMKTENKKEGKQDGKKDSQEDNEEGDEEHEPSDEEYEEYEEGREEYEDSAENTDEHGKEGDEASTGNMQEVDILSGETVKANAEGWPAE
jgi:hypothetical protein